MSQSERAGIVDMVVTFLRSFSISIFLTIAALVGVGVGYDLAAVGVTAVLIGIEVAFSFDNAIVNAKILSRLSPFWQKIFLTVGMLIAILGMRIVFPILIVMATAHETWSGVLTMAFRAPQQYAQALEHAHPAISAFGGSFLLMLVLQFFFDADKRVHWFETIEARAAKVGHWWLSSSVTLAVVLVAAFVPLNHHAMTTLTAGASGIIAYGLMRIVLLLAEKVAGRQAGAGHLTGMAAFATFMYLEVLDASFSFDGVLGAFAISSKIILIGAGLGVGALWVRSLTVFMVKRGVLQMYKYLEHGAHYAIAALALAMILSIVWNIPQLVTGLVTLGLIGASLYASTRALKAES